MIVSHVQTLTCPRCGRPPMWLEVPTDAVERYRNGLVSFAEAFPTLSLDEREQLTTGLHGTCWEETMKPIDDELTSEEGE